LIKRIWPAMHAEIATVVRQIARLAGPGINGFTDFATHGVVYVNRTPMPRPIPSAGFRRAGNWPKPWFTRRRNRP
jgi:hypothetical protein